jgi:hypothetical protein
MDGGCQAEHMTSARVIRDRIEPTASPAKSAMPPKAEANSEH